MDDSAKPWCEMDGIERAVAILKSAKVELGGVPGESKALCERIDEVVADLELDAGHWYDLRITGCARNVMSREVATLTIYNVQRGASETLVAAKSVHPKVPSK